MSVMTKDVLFALTKGALMPQAETLEISKSKNELFIGIPKEVAFQENRVPLVPDAVALLVNNGHNVCMERGAGLAAHFSDHEYSEAGAVIAESAKEVYKSDFIIKIAPPTLEEIEYMHPRQTLLSALQLTVQPEDFLKKLIRKKVNSVAFDLISDEAGIFPVIRAMGEIAGGTSITIAAELLSNVNQGMGSVLGGISGISPTEVVIIGAGTVGEFAARAALGLGATVKVFDRSTSRLRRLQSQLGSRIFTSVIIPKVLEKHLKTADVAIGALRASEGRTPCVVSEHMVREMKEAAVIIDVSIDQGGVFETSQVTNHTHPVFRKHEVIHYCVPNINSRVARTASFALSNIISQVLINMGQEGGFEGLIRKDSGFRNGVYVFNGTVTNSYLAESFKLPYKDIHLLMAAM